jgi:DNA-binding MarR family transcriptional regulator
MSPAGALPTVLLVEVSTKTYHGGMPTESEWLDPREDRAWRAFMHAHHHLAVRLNRLLLQDSGLTEADYEILAVLSDHPAGRMPAQEMYTLLQWEKSRLSHQVRRMQAQGLITREPNPADGRSAIIRLLPAGRRAIEDAAPQHVHNVRRHFIDLLTPAELDILAALNERILRHLAEEPAPDEPALPH